MHMIQYDNVLVMFSLNICSLETVVRLKIFYKYQAFSLSQCIRFFF